MSRPVHRLITASLLVLLCAAVGVSSVSAFFFKRDYRTERVVYSRPGSEKLLMTLYLPRESSEESRPAVALFHGGAWLVGTRHRVSWYAKRLAEHGYVAATVSYRMLPKYGFPACVHDAKAAIRWLRSHAVEYGIDPDRIAASGHSAGGHLAMMLGVTGYDKRFEGPGDPALSSRVEAVISVYGAVDLTVYKRSSKAAPLGGISHRLLNRFLRDVQEKGVDPFAAASPVTYIDAHSAPTLFIQGDEDGLVPPSVSATAAEKLKAAGVPVRRVLVKGAGHGFDYAAPRQRPMVLEEMLRFLGEHLAVGDDQSG